MIVADRNAAEKSLLDKNLAEILPVPEKLSRLNIPSVTPLTEVNECTYPVPKTRKTEEIPELKFLEGSSTQQSNSSNEDFSLKTQEFTQKLTDNIKSMT